MRVLITGGTGFIGRQLVQQLLDLGHEPVTLSRRKNSANNCDHISTEIDSPDLADIAKGFDAVVHLAGLADASSSFKNPVLYNRVNGLGTLNVLEACRIAGARFVLASTQRVYEPGTSPLVEDSRLVPQDPYGYSKLVAEQWTEMYFKYYSLPVVVLRFFSVYGPGLLVESGTSGVVSIFLQRALKAESLEIHGRQLRDFTDVRDVANGILKAIESPIAIGKTYNIATGEATSLAELAALCCEVTGSTSQIVYHDLPDENRHYVADISRAQRELGYKPAIDLRTGLTQYAEWLEGFCKSST